MARGKGKPPQVVKNRELIGASKAPQVVRDVSGKVTFRKTVGKTSIKPDRFKKSPKQLELPMKMPRISTKGVRAASAKQQTVGKAATKATQFRKPKQLDLLKNVKSAKSKAVAKNVAPSTQQAKKATTPKSKPKVKPATPPKTSLKQFVKNSAKTISKSISKGMINLRSYLKKNIAPKSQAKAKTIKRNSPDAPSLPYH